MTSPIENLFLVGYTMKPFGLVGELKVRPATFDPERHTSLARVFFKKKEDSEPLELEIRSTRADADYWFLKFKDMKTPEAVAHLSGGFLFVAEEDTLELPEDMVYVSDVPGMKVVDEEGKDVGTVYQVVDQGAQELLSVRTGAKELLIPWNDHFVKHIDKVGRIVHVDMSTLRGLL